MMRIGIFGGSFDPIHYGHLLLAEQCRAQADLDKVKFIPAAVPPHKPDRVLADAQNRLEMTRLAISGNDRFEVDSCELDRQGVSFTVDTLEQLSNQQKDAEWFLLIGGDSLVEFSSWHRPERICELATPLVYSRPGSEFDLSQLEPFTSDIQLGRIREMMFQAMQVEFSSTAIRRSIKNGKSIRYQVPRAVEKYIEEKKLYR